MNGLLRFIPTGARVLLGLVFFVFGLNGFLDFIPQPPLPESAMSFMGALAATGYMLPLIKGTEVVAGALLLSNRFVPLALVLLAPVLVNIAAFNLVMMPANTVMTVVLLACELTLAWAWRDAFRGVLAARGTPRLVASEGTPAQVARA
jgi:uncharacterized membrane protein YphA (DoxX/SURF4 family)